MKEVPWVEIGHNLSKKAFTISLLDPKGVAARKKQQTESKSSIGRSDTCRFTMMLEREEREVVEWAEREGPLYRRSRPRLVVHLYLQTKVRLSSGMTG